MQIRRVREKRLHVSALATALLVVAPLSATAQQVQGVAASATPEARAQPERRAAVSSSGHAELEVVASSPAHAHAARAYRAIWEQYGERIVRALETRTCLPFVEPTVTAVVADAVSHSGGPEHPMRLRATYPVEVKQSTLVHELGHRHLWQLAERLEDVDGHETLFLVLDRVWADVWGKEFAEDGIRGESGWRGNYDYAAAWTWARSHTQDARVEIWNRLLRMNGFTAACEGLSGAAP